ncbi:DUF2165 family protein [Photobacterium leiognathi]|uniref:DUF2165 family protein n=1 Tax=Photobacterium leiognathi TaxID=553611 RepID=UPI002739C6A0|nr:DUF2165 family protein [Photobacterium leiognathi]
MLKNIRKDKFEFGQSLYLIGGTGAALFVWFLRLCYYQVPKWFQMWASKWNGQMKHGKFIALLL